MAPAPDSSPTDTSRYGLRFGLTAAALGGLTLVLVLLVLPRRYVLGSGFQESGVSFPAGEAPFTPGNGVPRDAPAFPTFVTFADAPSVASGSGGSGPAETLWDMATPLMDRERYDVAAALFEDYLEDFPDDRSVLREYAIVLHWAGRTDATVSVLERLLGGADDREVRLVLARTLRDLGRPEEAHSEYRTLWGRSQEAGLALEWSRSWSWATRYAEGIDVLKGALARFPGHPELQVELARLHYYAGDLPMAASILGALHEGTLRRLDALTLRDDVASALAVPPAPETPTPTLLFRAVEARSEGRLEDAEELFRAALAEDPGDAAGWRAWADFLQYEKDDYIGARDALLRVLVLEGGDDPTELRIARLESWSGDSGAAEDRLESLLEKPSGTTRAAGGEVSTADVLALLGDLRRWDGDRVGALRRYEAATELDPDHPEARAGLEALRADVARVISSQEGGAGAGSRASALGDTDDYRRFDLRGEAGGNRGAWVWRGGVGYRWLSGIDLTGGAGRLQGLWGDFELARWSRQGTIRTGVRVGGDDVADSEPVLSASVRLLLPGSATAELAWDRGPGYLLLGTLQSGLAGYAYDRITLRGSRALTPAWSLSGDVQAARLDSDIGEIDPSFRLSVAAGITREWSPGVTWGAQLRALLFTDEAPVSGGRPLFWDPEGVVSGGPFMGLRQILSPEWTLRARAGAGAAYLDEARLDNATWAPQLDLLLGIDYGGSRLRGEAEAFYLQGQFQGYRSWGIRFRVVPGSRGGGTP